MKRKIIPGINPRQMQQMMRQMGMSQESLDVSEVIIKTKDQKVMKFLNPEVQKVKMQGKETFQVIGEYSVFEEESKIEIKEDDVLMVSEQAGVSKDEAMKALENSKGDIAKAILDLSNN